MTKPVLFDFSTATALQIVNAIRSKKTNSANLHTFRTRNGGSIAADKAYPATREALQILNEERKHERNAKKYKKCLEPFESELIKGRTTKDIIEPMLFQWQRHYKGEGIDLTLDQVLILRVLDGLDRVQSKDGSNEG